MRIRTLRIILAGGAGLLLSGCLHSAVDQRWGEAYHAALTRQQANPAAPTSQDGPEGVDAVTAELVSDRYYRGQESQETRRVEAVVIGELD